MIQFLKVILLHTFTLYTLYTLYSLSVRAYRAFLVTVLVHLPVLDEVFVPVVFSKRLASGPAPARHRDRCSLVFSFLIAIQTLLRQEEQF